MEEETKKKIFHTSTSTHMRPISVSQWQTREMWTHDVDFIKKKKNAEHWINRNALSIFCRHRRPSTMQENTLTHTHRTILKCHHNLYSEWFSHRPCTCHRSTTTYFLFHLLLDFKSMLTFMTLTIFFHFPMVFIRRMLITWRIVSHRMIFFKTNYEIWS